MNRQMTCGTSSIAFCSPVFIQSCACAVGPKEGQGPLGSGFDIINKDPMLDEDTWEAAESALQKQAATLAIQKAGLDTSDIRLLFAGDLLAQTVASSFGTAGLGIPFTDCLVPALPWENPSPWPPCALPEGTAVISCAPPPATSPVQKKNFVFPWDMAVKDPYQLPGRLPVPEPVYLDANLLQNQILQIPAPAHPKTQQNAPVLSEIKIPALS